MKSNYVTLINNEYYFKYQKVKNINTNEIGEIIYVNKLTFSINNNIIVKYSNKKIVYNKNNINNIIRQQINN